jgi:hypothetical protein
MEANDHQGPERPIPLGPQSPPCSPVGDLPDLLWLKHTHFFPLKKLKKFQNAHENSQKNNKLNLLEYHTHNSFADQKPSWHICKLTPKPSWNLLPKFKEKGPKPIYKKTIYKIIQYL